MTKQFVFDFHHGNSHRIITVELNFKPASSNQNKFEFTASGEVYTSKKNMSDGNCIAGGQCLDIFRYNEFWGNLDSRIPVIYNMWKKHHLNGMHAGTEAQEEALKDCDSSDYKDQCEYLKKNNLYEDNGYRYGSAWLYRDIPADDMQTIRSLFKNIYEPVDIKVTKAVLALIDAAINEN